MYLHLYRMLENRDKALGQALAERDIMEAELKAARTQLAKMD